MSYLLLIIENENTRKWPPAEGQRAYERMVRFQTGLKERGVLQASESLLPPSRGARVQAPGGRRLVVDGPFAEAKEIVGGFFLLDCASKAEAVAIAAECPATEWAIVEVREVGPCTVG